MVGQIAGDADLPGALEAYRPDVVLWDLGLERTTGSRRFNKPARHKLTHIGPGARRSSRQRGLGRWPARPSCSEIWNGATLLAALRAVFVGLTVLAPELSAALSPIIDRGPESLLGELTSR